jgi:hypothetical protein
MIDKKYQIFISSTYEDLKDERALAIQTILEMNHIPIGMEMFKASDDDQWAVIRRTIDTSDYYIVIIGQRYGSMTDTGISYTEKEYDYAVEQNIPVLAFVINDNAPVVSVRENDDTFKKLSLFKEKAKKKMTQFWTSKDELATKLSTSLYSAFKTHPRTGWIRSEIDLSAIVQEVAVLSKENRELRQQLDTFTRHHPKIDFDLKCENDLKFAYVMPDVKYRREYAIDDIPDSLIRELEEKEKAKSKNAITLGKLLSQQKVNHSQNNDNEQKTVIIDHKPTDYRKMFEEEIIKYNDALPMQAEYDSYNLKLTRFVNMTENRHNVYISLTNDGTAIANNIAITLWFPPELLVFDDYDINLVTEPNEIKIPIDPIEKIQHGTFEMPDGLRQVIELAEMFAKQPGMSKPIIPGALFGSRNYYTQNENCLCYEIEKLLHTHTAGSHDFYVVATKRGTFDITGEAICEGMPEPIKKTFTVIIE